MPTCRLRAVPFPLPPLHSPNQSQLPGDELLLTMQVLMQSEVWVASPRGRSILASLFCNYHHYRGSILLTASRSSRPEVLVVSQRESQKTNTHKVRQAQVCKRYGLGGCVNNWLSCSSVAGDCLGPALHLANLCISRLSTEATNVYRLQPTGMNIRQTFQSLPATLSFCHVKSPEHSPCPYGARESSAG